MKHAMLLHHDFRRMFAMLSDEEAGRILKAAMDYDIDGDDFYFEDRTLALCFERIKDFLDKNHKKYEETCRRRTQAAKKRWEEIEELKASVSN